MEDVDTNELLEEVEPKYGDQYAHIAGPERPYTGKPGTARISGVPQRDTDGKPIIPKGYGIDVEALVVSNNGKKKRAKAKRAKQRMKEFAEVMAPRERGRRILEDEMEI